MMTGITKITLNWARNVWVVAGGNHVIELLDDASIRVTMDRYGEERIKIPVEWLLEVNDQGLTQVVFNVVLWEHISWKKAARRVAKGQTGKGYPGYYRPALPRWRILINEVYGKTRRSQNVKKRFTPIRKEESTSKWKKI